MNELFTMDEFMMMGLVLFSSFWIFLFNYRQDNKEKYNGHWPLITLDLLINMGMSVTGYMLITVVFTNIPQLAPYESYRYPIGYLFGLFLDIQEGKVSINQSGLGCTKNGMEYLEDFF